MLWTKQGQAKSKGRRSSRSGKRITLDLGSGDGKQHAVFTTEGAGRLEADEAEVGAGFVAEEVDIVSVTSSFFRKVGLLIWRMK